MEVWFEGLTCWANSFRRKKRLLDNVSGRFLPGELTAIMGPSGAGKTTLLNAISGYRRRGVEGKMVEGPGRSFNYIAQEDIIDAWLTPAELMEFAGRLKLPANYTPKQRKMAVDDLISTLGLEDCVNSKTTQLSGGERKRLSIALELINNPPVLFLDEPTSGLDNVSSTHLVRLLSKLSKDGTTIVVTIHQPSASLLDHFDRMYILAMGKCVYQGGTGKHLLNFLATNGFICPIHHNPADFVIELMEENNNVSILCEATKNGRTSWFLGYEDNKVSSVGNMETGLLRKECWLDDTVSHYKPTTFEFFWIQFSSLFYKVLLQQRRNKTGLKLQIYHRLSCSLAVGIMFFQTANDGSQFVTQIKLCTAAAVFQAYTMQTVPMLYYPFEVKLLKKEHFNKWYNLLPYYLAFTFAKAPLTLILNVLDCTIVYSMSGIPWDLDRFLYFIVTGVFVGLAADALGHTIGSFFSPIHSCAIGPFTLTPFIGLATYGYDFMKTIHPFMDFIIQLSYVRSGLVANILVIYGLGRKELQCPDDAILCLYKDPKEVLEPLTMDRFSIPLMLLHLFINICIFRLTFYLALKWRLRR